MRLIFLYLFMADSLSLKIQMNEPISYSTLSRREFRTGMLILGSSMIQTTVFPLIARSIVNTETKNVEKSSSSKLSSVSVVNDLSIPPFINGNKVFIDGKISKFHGDISPVTSPIIDEKTHERTIIGNMAQMTKQDTIKVIESSTKAWNSGLGEWPQMSPNERIQAIENVIISLKEKRSEIIHLLMWEICKSLRDATTEFDRTIEFMEGTIDAYRNMNSGNTWKSINGFYAIIRRAAIGIMLCLGPYNYPFNETYATLIPALLMGNVVILKLPTVGGLAHILTMDAFAKHLPRGVVNFVSGSGRVTVGPMMKTGKIDMLAFIGSSQAADSIIKDHPSPHRLTTYLGLEAKNIALILPDADLDIAVNEVVLGSLSYNSRRCTAIKLTIAHKSIAKQFVEKFQEKVSELNIGMPWKEGVNITPLPEGIKKVDYLKSLINDAVSKGATVINAKQGGGDVVSGSLMVPAIVYPVSSNMRLWNEEQFGPVVLIAIYSDINKVIDYFKTTSYGQQTAIFTKNVKAAAPLIDVLSTTVGRINLNTQCGRGPDTLPFTGRRSSALGTLSITGGLNTFSVETVVAGKDNEVNRKILDQLNVETKFLN